MKENRYILIILPLSTIKDALAIELIAGTACYYILKNYFIYESIAMAGSMAGTHLIKKFNKKYIRKSKKPTSVTRRQ